MGEAERDTLRAAGLRRTPARERVLAIIEDVGAPVTHADIAAHPDMEGMDSITLYRTLTALEAAALVHRVHGIDGTWRYCAQPRRQPGCPGNHPHFLCMTCGKMQCLVEQALPKVQVPQGATVQGRHFLVFGGCVACSAKRVDARKSKRKRSTGTGVVPHRKGEKRSRR